METFPSIREVWKIFLYMRILFFCLENRKGTQQNILVEGLKIFFTTQGYHIAFSKINLHEMYLK